MNYLKKLEIKLVESKYKNPIKRQVRKPEQVFEIFKSIKDKAHETLIGVYFDKKLEKGTYDVLSTGSVSHTLIIPTEIFRRGILINSEIFILIHNHPSGDPMPSQADKEMIRKVYRKAVALEMTFLDFIIVGDANMNKKKRSYWSLFEELDGGEYSLGSVI